MKGPRLAAVTGWHTLFAVDVVQIVGGVLDNAITNLAIEPGQDAQGGQSMECGTPGLLCGGQAHVGDLGAAGTFLDREVVVPSLEPLTPWICGGRQVACAVGPNKKTSAAQATQYCSAE